MAANHPETNFPSGWQTFCAYAPNTGAEFFGFARPLPDVNRFAARYRAAASFKGIVLDGYSASTRNGYSALCRVMFAYSAFEAFLEVTGQTQKSVGPTLEARGSVPLISKVRARDTDRKFYQFIYDRVNTTHKGELDLYFNDDPCNVTYLASAIRHIFAHGWLTPSAGGGESSTAAEICNLMSDFLIALMNDEFSRRISVGMRELHGA